MTDEPVPPARGASDAAPEPSAEIATETPAETAAPVMADAPPTPRGAALVRFLVLLDLVLVVLAGAYVWRFPPWAAEARLVALAGRVAALAAPPPPSSSASAEVTALAARLRADEARLDTLAQQQAALAEMSQNPPQAAPSPTSPAPTPGVDADALLARLHDDEARLDALTERAGTTSRALAEVSDRAARLARLQAAGDALALGRPLGDLPGAPPALARYAASPPPTLVGLRAAFPAAAAAARAAAPSPTLAPGSRLMDWIGAVMTIRRGDQVLVGDTLAARLAAAQAALAGDDLAGALAALAPIAGAPAAALGPWKSEAADLLAARHALADLTAAK